MKNHYTPGRNVALLISAITTLGVSFSTAANYYLQTGQTGTNNWETVSSAQGWYDAASGGSQLITLDAAGDYFNNGFNLRTTLGDGGSTFGGASLNLSGGSVLLRSAGTSAVANLNSLGGTSILNAIHPTLSPTFSVTNFNNSGTTTIGSQVAEPGRPVTLDIGTLIGAGDFIFGTSSNPITLSITDATAFTGTMRLENGALLNFNSDFTSGGAFTISTGTQVTLDQHLTFSSLTIGDVTLGEGTHAYEDLSTTFGAIFTSGTIDGAITVVPEPNAFALLVGCLAVATVFMRRRRSGLRC